MQQLLFSPSTVALLVALGMLALVMAFRPGRPAQQLEQRMESFVAVGQILPGVSADPVPAGSFRERVLVPTLRNLMQKLGRLAPAGAAEETERKLLVAGHPGNLGALDYMGLCVLTLMLGVGGGFAYAQATHREPRMVLLAIVIGGLFGFMLPRLWLSSLISQRKAKIQRALPDAMDMLTVCVEAGLGFEAAMQRVSEQWKGILSDELARIVVEVRLGVPRPQAMRRLAQRCDLPDVSSFVAVLVQADSMGTSIANVLHSQSDQMRVLRRQRAEEAANKAPLKMLIPILIFIFPALFVVILGPAVPRIMVVVEGLM